LKPIELTLAKARGYLKPRAPDSRKGQNGRILIVGGSEKYYGSPALVARAAYRAGADLVYLLVPECIAPTVAGYSPDFIVWDYAGRVLNDKAFAPFNELVEKTDVMVIGNGLTKDRGALSKADVLAQGWKKGIVIDADCIGAVRKEGAVYTPHVVEFKRLSGEEPAAELGKRCEQVRVLAEKLKSVVLLKGKVDVISDGKKVAINRNGNAGMTVGGCGDSLAGLVAGMLGSGHENFEAACLGAFLNGLAGDEAYKELGNSLMASDLIEKVPAALKKLKA